MYQNVMVWLKSKQSNAALMNMPAEEEEKAGHFEYAQDRFNVLQDNPVIR